MNDELIARLRAGREPSWGTPTNFDALLLAAADALEAAQAEADENLRAMQVWRNRCGRAEAERDAEAALADQLADALARSCCYGSSATDGSRDAALAAHRERREVES